MAKKSDTRESYRQAPHSAIAYTELGRKNFTKDK